MLKSSFSRLISNVRQFDKHIRLRVDLSAFYEEVVVEGKLEKLFWRATLLFLIELKTQIFEFHVYSPNILPITLVH